MRRVEASGEIPAPPAEVFDFLADPTNLPRWQAGIVSAERTSDGPLAVGATARVVRELAGQRFAAVLSLSDYERPRRLALTTAVSGIGIEAALDLAPNGEAATNLRFAMTIKAQNFFMAPVEGMAADAAQNEVAASLARLREVFTDR
jgi:uncharacterized protein YndB with AHSA1/START domain